MIALGLIIFSPVPMYIACIVHAVRGNGQKFVILSSALILIGYFFYLCYIVAYAFGLGYATVGKLFYCLFINMLSLFHWIIASTYFECAIMNPF